MSKQRQSGSLGHGKAPTGGRRWRTGVPLLVWIGLGVVVMVVAAVLLIRPQQSPLSQITAAQAYEKYQGGVFFLDVRTQAEYDQGHIAKSVLVPLDELQNRLSEVPRDRDVVVVCRSGVRSKEGASMLKEAGYTRVSCLSGGLQAWVAAGYPVEQ